MEVAFHLLDAHSLQDKACNLSAQYYVYGYADIFLMKTQLHGIRHRHPNRVLHLFEGHSTAQRQRKDYHHIKPL
jgi:hypothetical protein